MVRFAVIMIALATCLLGPAAFGSGPILLLDFSSPTCGPCRQLEPLIHAHEQAGYPIRKVDTSQEPEMARQFGITKVPCFVMLVDGREVNRVVGTVDSAQLQQMFQQAKEVYVESHKNDQPRQPAPQGSVAERDSAASPAAPVAARETDWTPDSSGSAPGPIPDLPLTLVNATVRLRMEDTQGRSFGTGTIIDAREGEALIITCGHLFRASKGQGPVNVELFDATPAGVRVVGQVSGQVISYDLERDVALVSIRPGRPVTTAPIAPPGSAISRGDRVVSVGCSNGQNPTVLPSRISQLDRYQGPPNIEVAGAPVEGRSGGGLFNDRGELIGICNAADPEGNEGLYAALESIHDEVGRLQLPPNEAIVSNTPLPSTLPERLDNRNIYRGQGGQDPTPEPASMPASDRDSVAPPAGTLATGPNGRLGQVPTGLNATEQAAWTEIDKRLAKSDVTIIVQAAEPGGEPEVFRLRGASREFIRGLSERQSGPQATITR